jgi:hypothetical protein
MRLFNPLESTNQGALSGWRAAKDANDASQGQVDHGEELILTAKALVWKGDFESGGGTAQARANP